MRKIKDRCLTKDVWILKKILDENKRQLAKWGIQAQTPFEWLSYTTEELGELAKAISEYEYRLGSAEKVIEEAIQVATLAMKIAEMYMYEVDSIKEIKGG